MTIGMYCGPARKKQIDKQFFNNKFVVEMKKKQTHQMVNTYSFSVKSRIKTLQWTNSKFYQWI